MRLRLTKSVVQIIETEKELFMIMEHANGGELFDFIVRNTRLNEAQAAKFYWELISGIEYLHKSGVCHRDLKPENLLLDYDNTLKIVDFGLSNMYEKNETLKTACGSPCYAAPEVSKHSPVLILTTWADDCREEVPRPANRYLVERCRFLRDGGRLSALRGSQDFKSVQENYGCGVPNAKVPVARVQGFHSKNLEHGSRDEDPHQRHSQPPLHAQRYKRGACKATRARAVPRPAENALSEGAAATADERLLV